MNGKRWLCIFLFLLPAIFFSACSSTKHLTDNEYMLTRNSIKMDDVKGTDFDDLVYLLRPETNRKFAGILNFKTAVYASHQPKVDTVTGVVRDSKFNRWMRESIGEPPVLLDSSQIDYSVEQLQIAMQKRGYFNSVIRPEVLLHPNNQKARVNYHIEAREPYFIREIDYQVSIPEYRKIILLDTANSLIKKGTQYNEDLLSQERNRIANVIRNNGYYYVTNSLITIEVDTFGSSVPLDHRDRKTVALNILVNFDEVKDPSIRERAFYKYTFDKVYIYTNYNFGAETNTLMDTVIFRSFRNKNDSTNYYFITPKLQTRSNKSKIHKDFKYKTITDILYTKSGWPYSQYAYERSFRRLSELRNFNIINIEFIENTSRRDSIRKEGVLDTRYKLTRSKLHAFSTEIDVRSNRSNLAFTYTNKNIFKGAEHLNINVYGGVYYYNWLFNRENQLHYMEVGGSVSLDFPRLFILKQTQNIEALRYSTSLRLGVNYTGWYKRLMLNAGLTYNWNPNYNINHSVTPLNIITLDTSRNTIRSLQNYPEEYKSKFNRKILISLNYTFNYLVPIANKKHNLRLMVNFESSGLTMLGINKLANSIRKKDEVWKIAGYNYATFELMELNLRYYYIFNKNNSFASRFSVGAAIPFYNFRNNTIPFEKSFYLGGANSMRAWAFRSLGPGSFYSENYIERMGDIKLEMNLEYRGTIYKAVKYGIFVDMGNIWMSRPYADMPGAELKLNRFYKEIAIGAGAGLRFDFNFFLIRLDYGIAIHDPSAPGKKWINKEWVRKNENGKKFWNWAQGIQFAIGHAF